jgi:hypothetical protein
VSTLEEQIRDLLTAEEDHSPESVDLDAIHRGVARRRHHRVGAAAAVVAAVAAAITVPVVLHGSPAPPARGPVATQSAPAPAPGIALRSTFTPTWLPAGLVETGRSGQVRARPGFPASVGRSFASTDPNNQTNVAVTDLSGPTKVPTSAKPVTIAGRSGMGWVDQDSQSYVVQVKWSAGHWLYVAAGNGKAAKDIAVHVGNSIVARTANVTVPVTCSGPGCTSFNIVNVSGATSRDLRVELIGVPLVVELDHSPNTPANNAVVHLRNGWYAHFGPEQGATTQLSHAQLVAISKTFRVHGKLSYPWAGKRP